MNKIKILFVVFAAIILTACTKYERVPIERHFWAPNTFSPNNDGLNDAFYIKPAFGVDIRELELKIFDQNFQTIHTYDGDFLYPVWSGTTNGIEYPQGIYDYQILYEASEDSINYNLYGTQSTIQLVREN